MEKFRFVGTELEIGNRRYVAFGQVVDIPTAEVDGVVYAPGGAKVVTEAQFAAAGFTPDEVRKYAYPGAQMAAPADFKAKLEKVRAQVGMRDTKQEIK